MQLLTIIFAFIIVVLSICVIIGEYSDGVKFGVALLGGTAALAFILYSIRLA